MTNQRRVVQGSAGGGGGGVSSLHAIAPNQCGWTEEDIRRSLDGTFTSMDWGRNRAVTYFVPTDHIPRHIDVRGEACAEPEKWTPDEDMRLVELVKQGTTRLPDLAAELDRSEESVHSRLRRLRKARLA